MAKSLLERSEPETVAQYEAAAGLRFNEANALHKRGHNLGAIYLFGYSIELRIKAAFFALKESGRGPIQSRSQFARPRGIRRQNISALIRATSTIWSCGRGCWPTK